MDALFEQIRHVQISKQTAVAGFTLFLFDTLITLDDEVKYIWNAGWSVSKVLFLLVRWPWLLMTCLTLYSFVATPSPSTTFCRHLWNMEGFAGILELGLVQYILALRVKALYSDNKRVGVVLMVLPVLCVGYMLGLNGYYANHLVFTANPMPGVIVGCFRNCTNCSLWTRIFYWPMLLFDLIIFVLTVVKAWQHARTNVKAPVLTVLYRDGFLYFIAIFAATLVNLVIWNSGKDSLLEIMVFVLRALSAVMSCRLVLNLRGTVSCPLKDDSKSNDSSEDAHHPVAIVMNNLMGVKQHSNPPGNNRSQTSTHGAGNVLHTLNQNETTHGGLNSFIDPGTTQFTIDQKQVDIEVGRTHDGGQYSSRSLDTEEDDDDDDGAIIFHRPQFPPGAILNGRETGSVGSIPAVLKERRTSMKPS